MNPENQTVEEYLKATSELCKSMNRRCGEFNSLYEFVLTHGCKMDCKRHDDRFKIRLTPRQCYRNAYHLAMEFQGQLIYCEGYASVGQIPLAHAWCITHAGIVVDPTWMDRGVDYFGVALRTGYISNQLRKMTQYGFLDSPEHKFPLLRLSPNKWKHPINDRLTTLKNEQNLWS